MSPASTSTTTLPLDWHWICCDQDHGQSSSSTSTDYNNLLDGSTQPQHAQPTVDPRPNPSLQETMMTTTTTTTLLPFPLLLNPTDPTESQLAQWMTYCCTSSDCLDPIQPQPQPQLQQPSALHSNSNSGPGIDLNAVPTDPFKLQGYPYSFQIPGMNQGTEQYCCSPSSCPTPLPLSLNSQNAYAAQAAHRGQGGRGGRECCVIPRPSSRGEVGGGCSGLDLDGDLDVDVAWDCTDCEMGMGMSMGIGMEMEMGMGSVPPTPPPALTSSTNTPSMTTTTTTPQSSTSIMDQTTGFPTQASGDRSRSRSRLDGGFEGRAQAGVGRGVRSRSQSQSRSQAQSNSQSNAHPDLSDETLETFLNSLVKGRTGLFEVSQAGSGGNELAGAGAGAGAGGGLQNFKTYSPTLTQMHGHTDTHAQMQMQMQMGMGTHARNEMAFRTPRNSSDTGSPGSSLGFAQGSRIPGQTSPSSPLPLPLPRQGRGTGEHVCHWANCHERFQTVSLLLSHISTGHLNMGGTGTDHQDRVEVENATEENNGGYEFGRYQKEKRETDDGAFSLPPTVLHGSERNSGREGGRNEGLMACLWDDCIPPLAPVHKGKAFLGAFAKDHIGLEGTTRSEFSSSRKPDGGGMDLDEGDSNHSNHPISHCQKPVPIVNDNPLDSASAVLKHLLEQHLGTEATRSLLDIAQNHYTVVAAANQNEGGNGGDVPLPKRRESGSDTVPPSGDKEPTPFACRWHGCDKVFQDNGSLTEHISAVHVGRGKSKYECLWEGCVRCEEECDSCDEGEKDDVPMNGMGQGEKRGRKFATRQKVLRHIQSHTGYRPFVCHICGQSVSEQATLNAHLRRHAEEKPFKCDEEGCDKAFASAASLAVHKRAHEGAKTHVCHLCGRGFVELSNLTKHIRTHTGDKPFSCPLNGCGRAFCRSDQLKRHMMTCRHRDKSSGSSDLSISPT